MIVQKVWGTETVIANNALYCGKIMNLNKGWQCSLHHHKIKDETFYILSGRVWFERDGFHFELNKGDSVHIHPGTKHRFAGLTDAVIVEISTTHTDDDVYRDEESGEMA